MIRFRRRKDLAIHVHPDRRVTVDAPVGTKLDQVATRVARRSDWIAKQRRFFEKFQPLPPDPAYVSGETHRYLGRQYRLKVVTSDEPTEAVKLVGRYFWVTSGTTSTAATFSRCWRAGIGIEPGTSSAGDCGFVWIRASPWKLPPRSFRSGRWSGVGVVAPGAGRYC